MNLAPYRRVLANPGVKALLLVSVLMRLPFSAMGMALLFHVRFELDRSYFQAGAVMAALTVGTAVSGPFKGRLIDKLGLRPVIAVTGTAGTAFFAAATVLPYPLLLPAALVGGVLSMPVFGAVRQGLAALVPAGQRRTVYSLDAMVVELAFVVGPAMAILVATWNSHVALLGVAVLQGLSALTLYLHDPPTRSEDEIAEAAGRTPPPRREWLRGPLIAMMVGAAGATLALAGTEVAVVALLKTVGEEPQAGVVLAFWAAYSAVGGFLYGGLRRDLPPLPLLLGLCAAMVPLGFFASWWLLTVLLIPAGLLLAPTMTAMIDRVTQLVPASVRGEALGTHGSAVTVGNAIGAPLTGAVIDAFGPFWGFPAAGGAGMLLALAAMALMRFSRPIRAGEPAPNPPETMTA